MNLIIANGVPIFIPSSDDNGKGGGGGDVPPWFAILIVLFVLASVASVGYAIFSS